MCEQVTLIGFLGDAPELKFSQQGKPVCTFSLAVDERWKDAEGAPRERVEWFKIVCFGRLAEVSGEYLVPAATFTWKAGCRPGSGKTVEARSAQQSKSWPTRCRFSIEPPKTGTVRRRRNHQSHRGPSMRATIPSMHREARRRSKISRFKTGFSARVHFEEVSHRHSGSFRCFVPARESRRP